MMKKLFKSSLWICLVLMLFCMSGNVKGQSIPITFNKLTYSFINYDSQNEYTYRIYHSRSFSIGDPTLVDIITPVLAIRESFDIYPMITLFQKKEIYTHGGVNKIIVERVETGESAEIVIPNNADVAVTIKNAMWQPHQIILTYKLL